MGQTPSETGMWFLGFVLFWATVVVFLLLAPRRWERAREFRCAMLAHRRASLVVALAYLASALVASKLDPGRIFGSVLRAVAIYCQCLIGLALAYGIPGFEPLPVTRAIEQHTRPVRAVLLMLLFAVVIGAFALVAGSMALGIGQNLFHETARNSEAVAMLPGDKFFAFFALLSGAGIFEETTFRLVLVSFFWRLLRRRWLAILLAAAAFGAYHLLPLNGMYTVFWQYPGSQFFSSMVIGVVWGYLYAKRGYESTVAAHSLQDFIGVLFFA